MGRLETCRLENTNTCHKCLSASQAIGLAFSTQAGCISFAAVLLLFFIVWVKYKRSRRLNPHREHVLLRSHLDVYMLNLFISELLMSLGGVLDAKWANETQVYCGGYCAAQGSLQFIGETSVAIWTLAITLHTWWSVVYAKRVVFRPWICFGLVAAVWVFLIAFNFGAYTSYPVGEISDDNYFTPTPFWCWINPKYKNHRAFGEYMWLWVAGFGNLLVYIPLYLLLRGNIILGNEGFRSHTWHWTPPPRQVAIRADSVSTLGSAEYDEETSRKDAVKMLLYPIAYTILVLPLSVVRWMSFVNPALREIQQAHPSMAAATLIFHATFRLSGVVNVGLVLLTRPNVLLFGERSRGDDDDDVAGGVDDTDKVEQNNGEHPLRQRSGTGQGTNAQMRSGTTGFGGPTVRLNLDDDGMRRER
ncbi:hypothetical protein BDV93DRAFT_524730 [Ceratobasidium sp. AG-I]|nr:hypothetical protein BDV93DRAFT_524730 [Ceratobasidium sp. AG-I]